MLQFKKITLEDKDLLTERLQKLNCKLLNYNFVVLFIYRDIIHFEYAISEDFLLLKVHIDGVDRFLFPVGNGNLPKVLDEIKEYAFSRNQVCHFLQFCEHNAPLLMEWADGVKQSENRDYKFYDVRGDFEYIYLAEKLIKLEGHEYKPKRNHVNHFLKHNQWGTEMINEQNMAEVIAFSQKWDNRKEVKSGSRLDWENRALQEIFDHYDALEIKGLLLRTEGKIVAFAVGCPLCDDTYLVLFEKGDSEVNGSYAMINREFVSQIAAGYTYINRAEDLGVEGLRKAKMSYNPEFLQKVFHLELS